MPPGDARVDDGDANAGAGEAEAPLNGARAGRDGGTEVMSRRRSVVVDPEDFGPRFELPQDVIRQVEHLAVDDAETSPGAREPLELLGKRRAGRQRDDDAGDLPRIALTTPGQLGIELRPAAGRERKRRENEAKEEGRDERHEAPARVPDSFGTDVDTDMWRARNSNSRARFATRVSHDYNYLQTCNLTGDRVRMEKRCDMAVMSHIGTRHD